MEEVFDNIGCQSAGIAAAIRKSLPQSLKKDPALLPVLNLAYMGDTVFDLYVRTLLVENFDDKVHALHLKSAKRVCAKGQAEAFHKIEPLLSQEELAIYKRGRNSHMGTVAKNASITDYRTATGLEALIGYLYLSNKDERLCELMKIILE